MQGREKAQKSLQELIEHNYKISKNIFILLNKIVDANATFLENEQIVKLTLPEIKFLIKVLVKNIIDGNTAGADADP